MLLRYGRQVFEATGSVKQSVLGADGDEMMMMSQPFADNSKHIFIF